MICNKCGLEKGDEFRKGRKQCKSCEKEYRATRIEKTAEINKKWYDSHKELVATKSAIRYLENKEEIERNRKEKQHPRKYREKHRKEINEKKKKHRQQNIEAYKKRDKEYHKRTYIPTVKGGPSKGEKKLLEICENLLQRGYIEKYDKEITHSEIKMQLPCPFDCAIWADNNRLFFVEYHGQQHYKHVNFSGSLTEEQLEDNLIQTQWSDKNKRITCAKLGIPLLVIPYWQYKKMEECLVNFLQFHGVDFD